MVDAKSLHQIILDTGHHQPAADQGFTAGASAAAMPMSGPLPPPPLGLRLDGGQEMATNKRTHHQQSSMLAEKVCTTSREQRQRHISMMISTVVARARKQLEAKDQEIEWIRSMNWALKERIRNLHIEAQAWCNVAQSNETVANVLRADLQQVLEQQAFRGSGSNDSEDAAGSCWGEKHVAFCREEQEEEEVEMCKGCGQSAPVVLLLPCRHLCVCAPCAEAAQVCPSCICVKTGSISVNFP
ncbi:hypothetical protein VPH35_103204 [Triticum aestivum]